jgi:hypothetical protein
MHTKALRLFATNEDFCVADEHAVCSVDYTYESFSNGCRSSIDHCVVSQNVFDFISLYHVTHDIDNVSDLSVISIHVDIPVEYTHVVIENEAKLLWSRATEHDIDVYKTNLNNELLNIVVDPDILYCKDHRCQCHLE